MSSSLVVDRCDYSPGQTVNGKYTVRKTLGEGSFGVVYLVEDYRRQPFALKLLRLWEVPQEIREPLKKRFGREFHTGQIGCHNLVQSVDYGKVGGNPYIVMEFCPGGDLEPRLGHPDGHTPRICQEILVGLYALHSHGKVHRDLKPENVLFKQDGTAALTDFGIAGDRNHRMTQLSLLGRPNQMFGTYAYMPPEQVNRVRGGATVKPTTDIFSYGVLVYQLLTGQLPFGSLENHNELAEYQKRGKNGTWNRDLIRRLPDSDKWMRLIEGCLIPDYEKRLQTVSEVMRMIPQSQSAPKPVQLVNSYRPVPAKYARGYQLRVMQGEEYGRTYDLNKLMTPDHRVVTVGRVQGNAVLIKAEQNDYMSRRHCTIEASRKGQWVVRDGQWNPEARQWLLSRNGTYVNSRPVTPDGYYLSPGDILAMGGITMRFENY
ncbi:MAG: protein kinase [Prevotella sp.]|nr:protein kinase [Prevotella sp.]